MIVPIAVCLAFSIAEHRRTPDPADEFAFDRWGRAGLALYGAVLLVVALFFSLSRGGILSSAISGLLLFFLVARRLDSKLLVWSTAVVLIVLAVGFIGWIGADVVSAQIGTYATMGNETSFQARWVVWDTLVENLGPFLWVGSGLGTFEEGFAPITPPGSSRRWDRAHDDYLQLLWETGLVGMILLLAAGFIFIRRYWWPALRARGHGESLLRVGLAVSLMTIALHSLVDFNLQIGSNGFLFALLAGLLVGLDRLDHARAAAARTPRDLPSPAGTSVVADAAGSA
jgi:O-antigen ligase